MWKNPHLVDIEVVYEHPAPAAAVIVDDVNGVLLSGDAGLGHDNLLDLPSAPAGAWVAHRRYVGAIADPAKRSAHEACVHVVFVRACGCG